MGWSLGDWPLVTQAEGHHLLGAGQVGEGWLWGAGPCAVPKDRLAGRAVSPQPGRVLGCQSTTIRRKKTRRMPFSGVFSALLTRPNASSMSCCVSSRKRDCVSFLTPSASVCGDLPLLTPVLSEDRSPLS